MAIVRVLVWGFQLFLVTIVLSQPGDIASNCIITEQHGEHPDSPVKIGVLANRGYEKCMKEWGPTAEYLNQQLSPIAFEIVPLGFNEIFDAVRQQQVCYVIANPSYYACLEKKGQVVRIATLQIAGEPFPHACFGGVIFTYAQRTDIQSLQDLKGKRFSAVDHHSLGGWNAALYELKKNGVNPHDDFKKLRFEGSHDAVVQAVLAGRSDAGTVRSTQLERMAKEGYINLSDIKVIHTKDTVYPNYNYLLSTRLYPEWPVAALPHTDPVLSKSIAIALLQMEENDPAAKALRSSGWDIPQDYTKVHDLLRFLRLPPYEDYGKVTPTQVLQQYWLPVSIGLLLLIALFTSWVYLKILNKKIRNTSQKLMESENQFRVLFENSSVAIIVHDPETCEVISANKKAISSYGYYNFSEFKRADIWLEPPYSLSDAREWFRKVQHTNRPHRFEWKSRSLSGQVFWEEVILQQIRLRGKEYIISTSVDITHKKEKERLEKEHLEKKVEIAQKTLQFKQNFLANMSHEIRTPLTGIIGMVDLLEQTQVSPDQKEYIEILKSSGQSLREIINQVLDFSKIEAGKLTLNPSVFQFSTLIENAHKLFGATCKKKISFEINTYTSIPDFIEADYSRLSQVLNNLVSNAVKFTPEGKITLSAKLLSQDPASQQLSIRVEVKDTGVGIPKYKQKVLFTPFSQIEEKDNRTYEGTGLGLSICKELVRLHGGEMGFVSKYRKGSMFWFTFKANKAEPPVKTPHESKEETPAESDSLNILLCEDKKVNQKVISLMLQTMGHNVSLASNGKDALKIFKPGLFDLILMDIQMPVMDGITATQKLREKYKTQLPPIIGLSANAFEGDREKYISQGMDEYLTKPIKGDDFKLMIEKVM